MRWAVGVGVWAVAVVAANVWAQQPLPIENLRLPLEHHPDGTVKRQLTAAQAYVPDRGPIKARDVTMKGYRADGTLEMVVTADECTYHRDRGKVTSSSAVRAVTRGVLISGKGFEWDARTQTVTIKNRARVVFVRGLGIPRLDKVRDKRASGEKREDR